MSVKRDWGTTLTDIVVIESGIPVNTKHGIETEEEEAWSDIDFYPEVIPLELRKKPWQQIVRERFAKFAEVFMKREVREKRELERTLEELSRVKRRGSVRRSLGGDPELTHAMVVPASPKLEIPKFESMVVMADIHHQVSFIPPVVTFTPVLHMTEPLHDCKSILSALVEHDEDEVVSNTLAHPVPPTNMNTEINRYAWIFAY